MSPRTTEQFEEIREQKRQLIMNTALLLFATRGYHETSISDIASRAGISKGLIYNYFESKEELIRRILNEGAREILEFFDRNRDGELTEEELVYFIHRSVDILKSRIHYWKLYFAVAAQPQVLNIVGEEFREPVRRTMEITENYFRKQGRLHPAAEAWMFNSLLDGVSLNYLANPDRYPIDDIKQMIIQRYIQKPS